MARAKNTARAEARRRHRASRSAALAATEDYPLDDELEVGEEPVTQPPRRSAFALPDIPGDLRAFPAMFRTRKLLWLPFILLFAAFGLGLAANAGLLPAGLAESSQFLVQFLLQPPALILFFFGGFLAPRGSYLVGLLLGILSGPIYAVWLVNAIAWGAFTLEPGTLVPTVGDLVVPLTVQSSLFGMLAGGFASWYRGFLRSSQERARQNRIARDQQARIKAKEQERKDRDAAREARKTAAQKPT